MALLFPLFGALIYGYIHSYALACCQFAYMYIHVHQPISQRRLNIKMHISIFQKKTNRKTPEKTSQMLELERINRRRFRLDDQSPVKSPVLGVSLATVGRTTHSGIGANSLKATRMFQTSAWVSYKPSGAPPSLHGFPIQKG